ncbi:MAG: VCP-like ATPase [Methanosaeta sp. PtaB.Bin039]|nr:MAG: VCP-like ATPase [Methanosaeta sp. PtaB.Bin039]OPY44958.1 MAG: VCP-like ATPase [Methanosaeta sp. PtaU1.Bin028]HOT07399.1 ATP-binding protein [Methanotrichaceae archaeon]HQF15883.1 ATP-binding protein [Methanotrichaceae archaeon]HQI90441.1 ATP-binding protein [Methanotrichaceae archaeon]
MMGSEKSGSTEVAELLLTAEIYNRNESLNEDDLPPKIRKHYFDPAARGVKRPIYVTIADVEKIYGLEDVRGVIKGLPFVYLEEFGSQLRLTVFDLGAKWFANQKSLDLIKSNPTLSHFYQNYDSLGVDYSESKKANRPRFADREWIDAKISELTAEVKDSDEVLKLVQIRSPEDIRDRIEDLVLTEEQKSEIAKAEKAIQHRDYLREVGLREIGKLLFVGGPGTGKTSTARAISHWLGLPLVEVRLSMITSQYLGETSKNIDKVFDLAKRLSPCILFVDEFDFVAKTRTSDEHGAIKRAVNTLLKAIDEVSLVQDGVLLIAATNHPQLLDYAAWRRFDKVLSFPLPDKDMRRRILDKVLSKIDTRVDTDELAALTEGYSGSDLRLVVREAVLNALLQDRTSLDQGDLLRAVEEFERRISEHRRAVPS